MAGEELKKVIEDRGIKYIGFLIRTLKDGKSNSFTNEEEIHYLFVSRIPEPYIETLEKENKLEDLTLVILKSSLLYEKDNYRTYYPIYHKNPEAIGYKTRLNESSFERLFLNRLAYKTKTGEIHYCSRKKELPNCYTTLSSASIEWEGSIDSKYVLYTIPASELYGLCDFFELLYYRGNEEAREIMEEEEKQTLEKIYDEAIRRDSLYGTNEAEQYSKALIRLSRSFTNDEEYDEDIQSDGFVESATYLPSDPEEDYWETDMGYKEPDDYGNY